MTVVFPERVSVAIARYGVYEEGLTGMVMDYLKPGMVFFDVGAHFGYFSLLAAWLVGTTRARSTRSSRRPAPSTSSPATSAAGRTCGSITSPCSARSRACRSPTTALRYAAFNTLGGGKLDDATKAGLSPRQVTVRAIVARRLRARGRP